MAKLTLTQQVEALTAQVAALLASQAAAPAAQAPAAPTFATSTNGVKFPCTAETPCARTSIKTALRAASHGADGHEARDAATDAKYLAARAK
jgi:hypothetical protein